MMRNPFQVKVTEWSGPFDGLQIPAFIDIRSGKVIPLPARSHISRSNAIEVGQLPFTVGEVLVPGTDHIAALAVVLGVPAVAEADDEVTTRCGFDRMGLGSV